MRNKTLAAIGGALLGTLGLASQASAEDWIVSVGGQVNAAPPYEGAGYDLFLPIPTLGIRKASAPERPTISGDAPGIAVISNNWISFGPDLRLRGSRDDKGDREGLHKVGIAGEPGLFLTLWPMDWVRLHGEERKGVFGDHGWVGDAGLDLIVRPGRFMISAGPRIGWGDRSYMNPYFGVTAADAAASPILNTTYSPNGGRRYLGAGAGLTYHFSSRWEGTATASYHHLSNQAADSPIVQLIGARNEYAGGVGLKYSFGWSR